MKSRNGICGSKYNVEFIKKEKTAETVLKEAVRYGNKRDIRQCFQALYLSYAKLIYRVVITKVGPVNHLEDDVDEAFLLLLSKPERVLLIDNLGQYIVAAAVNIALSNCRKERARDVAEYCDESQSGDLTAIPDQIDSLEVIRAIKAELGSMDFKIVMLHAGYGYSFKEIASRLSLGEDAVFYRYKKAMVRLKKEAQRFAR